MNPLVKDNLSTEVNHTFQELINTLSQFQEEQFNQAPYEGSWTPGQIAEHLVKSVSAVPDEHTAPTQRPYDEKVAPLGDLFLDFSIKMKSPDFIKPDNSPQDQQEMLNTFSVIKEYLEKTVQTTDLEATCTDFEMPVFGALTRYEWIKFFVFHTQRHTRQLKEGLISLNTR